MTNLGYKFVILLCFYLVWNFDRCLCGLRAGICNGSFRGYIGETINARNAGNRDDGFTRF